MATIHTHANAALVNRFTIDVTLISFRILIFVSLEVSYGWQRMCNREDSPLCWRDINTIERRSDVMNDSGPPTDQNDNGMKAAGSVMKAAGEWMKRSCGVCAGL
jgi:hypothetical protein